ncbi:MAG: porin family protein [Chitinispirillaceae bacterium]
MRVLISILTILFVVANVSALEMSVGAKGGVGLSMFYGAEEDAVYDDQIVKPGFIGGAFYEMALMEYFSIQPEVLFVMKGSRAEEEQEGITVDITNSLNYLEIPILLIGKLPLGAITPQVFAGPAVAFRVGTGGSIELEGEGADAIREFFPTDDEIGESLDEQTNTIDFGIAMGAGVAIDFSPGEIILDVRYTLGLMDVYNEDEVPEGEQFFEHKNANLSFMAGYSIGF